MCCVFLCSVTGPHPYGTCCLCRELRPQGVCVVCLGLRLAGACRRGMARCTTALRGLR